MTSSVEFIDEILPPRPRQYYYYDPYQSLETLTTQFSQHIDSYLPDSYKIGLDNFDLTEIRHVIEG